MNKDTAKDCLPLVQALADGRSIKYRIGAEEWYDREQFDFSDKPENYRIKPEPREIWVNEWDGNGFVVFSTEREAMEHANRYGIGHMTTRYREVME